MQTVEILKQRGDETTDEYEARVNKALDSKQADGNTVIDIHMGVISGLIVQTIVWEDE